MRGKDKCKILKELRAQIAAANDIEWVTENCTHKGECRGTCPKCEAEVVMLERALERRKALGKTVAVTGLAVGMMVASTSCAQFEQWQVKEGEMLMPSDQTTAAAQVTTSAGQTVTEGIEFDGMMGVPVAEILYYYTDFTLCQSRTFETTKEIYFEGVGHQSARWLPEGVRFEVIGETADMWLVRYEDSYYCVWKDELNECASEVLTDTETPDVED